MIICMTLGLVRLTTDELSIIQGATSEICFRYHVATCRPSCGRVTRSIKIATMEADPLYHVKQLFYQGQLMTHEPST